MQEEKYKVRYDGIDGETSLFYNASSINECIDKFWNDFSPNVPQIIEITSQPISASSHPQERGETEAEGEWAKWEKEMCEQALEYADKINKEDLSVNIVAYDAFNEGYKAARAAAHPPLEERGENQDREEGELLKQILREAVYTLEYAAYNIDGSKLENLPQGIMESTGVAESCLISARNLNSYLQTVKA